MTSDGVAKTAVVDEGERRSSLSGHCRLDCHSLLALCLPPRTLAVVCPFVDGCDALCDSVWVLLELLEAALVWLAGDMCSEGDGVGEVTRAGDAVVLSHSCGWKASLSAQDWTIESEELVTWQVLYVLVPEGVHHL